MLTTLLVMLSACHPTRFLEDDEIMLSKVSLTSKSKQEKAGDYRLYVRQEANARWFSLFKVPLGIYCISGKDKSKKTNRFIQRLGEAPVVYDHEQTVSSATSLQSALQGKGYLHAKVDVDTASKNRKLDVHYTMHPGIRWYVSNLEYSIEDSLIASEIKRASDKSLLYKGMPLDVAQLSSERERVVRHLHDCGFYELNKDFVSFIADTLPGENNVRLTFVFRRPPGVISSTVYQPYTINSVNIYEDVDGNDSECDSINSNNINIIYKGRHKMSGKVYDNHVAIREGKQYSEQDMQDTYSSLNGLPAVNYSSIHFVPNTEDSVPKLDANIFVKSNAHYSISAEADGTNTNGDLGAAVTATFTNRNLFKGAEAFTLKLRGAYEAITGLEGYSSQDYMEYSVESSLRLPTFKFPFLPRSLNRNLKAVSEISLMYNSQDRPEFHRRVLTGRWAYQWSHHNMPNWQHNLDVLSLNYVFLPWISETFEKEYLEGENPRYSILRNSYENLFIMKSSYGFVYNSLRNIGQNGINQTNGYQIRFNAEIAGNILFAASKIFRLKKDESDQYNIFNIAYSQYAKFDFDYAKSFLIDENNSLALHAAFGIAIPYGNSKIIPYEKRYFAGGANNIRGWSVRELGPGNYSTTDGKVNFINQTGNMNLLLSLEYRTRLFWKFNGAAFIDAGNIWNLRSYENIPGGEFKFGKFYKQIAVSYGLGIRFNLDYFIVRFDAGMKAINPAIESGSGHWPIAHPKLSRDFTLHFAVGLPF